MHFSMRISSDEVLTFLNFIVSVLVTHILGDPDLSPVFHLEIKIGKDR